MHTVKYIFKTALFTQQFSSLLYLLLSFVIIIIKLIQY